MTIYSLDIHLSQFWPVCCSMSSSNSFFLSCIQVTQEASKVVWYSHLFKNFPVCCDPHKSISIANKAELDFGGIFLDYIALSMIQQMLAIWSLLSLPFLNPACTSGSPQFMYCWSFVWRILSITLLACEMSATVWLFEHSLALPFKEIKPVNPKGNSVLNIHWKGWCWKWSSNTLATWCEELTHWKRPWS